MEMFPYGLESSLHSLKGNTDDILTQERSEDKLERNLRDFLLLNGT